VSSKRKARRPAKPKAAKAAKAPPEGAAASPESSRPEEPGRRIPTPVVLALVSAMVCAGLVGLFWNSGREPIEVEELPTAVEVDDRTPEAAAESFLDAWRKRDHSVAETLALGDALAAVRSRRDGDESGDPQLERIWNRMAAERLEFVVDEAETLDDGMRLVGVASGTFLSQPYAREVAFSLRETPDGWRVTELQFGEILEGGQP